MSRRNTVVPLARPQKRRQGRFGELEVVAPLAKGGMGGVYLATAESGERVALKVLDPQFATCPDVCERLYAEHALASRTRHPGLLEIRDARRTADGVPYLVMEYLDGTNLAAIADEGELPLQRIVGIAAQAASALAALHEAGVVHCDVKHENIHVTASGRVKVIDFGVSRLAGDPPAEDASIAGTPWCMAPEQWAGKPVFASDVYALGCVLYELTTGAPPFDGSLPELMTAHMEQRPARPSWLRAMPIELERIIMRALAKDAAARPTMHEVAGELLDLLDSYEQTLQLTKCA